MKVRDLIQTLNKLDLDKDIEIGMYQKNLEAYYFRSGCSINEEYGSGNYVILPNSSDVVEFNK